MKFKTQHIVLKGNKNYNGVHRDGSVTWFTGHKGAIAEVTNHPTVGSAKQFMAQHSY